MENRKALQLVDFLGIGNLLNHLVAEDVISCDERDRIIQRITRDNGFTEVESFVLAGYGRSKDEVQERTAQVRTAKILCTISDEEYLSLTEIVQAHSSDTPGYVIQSWLRSENTLAFLNLWEKENNPSYCEAGYRELLKKKRTASLSLRRCTTKD